METNPSDRSLVDATLRGDSDAFALLHKRYYARVFRLALLRCRNQADAEDVASETFVKAIAHLPSYQFRGESLLPWLARIAANIANDQGRKFRGATFVSLDTAEAARGVRAVIEGLPQAPDPHTLAERGETQALVRAAIARLPSDQADAIMLRFGGDLPLREIALSLNRSEGAVKSLLHRALVNLRQTLGEAEAQAAKEITIETTKQGEAMKPLSQQGEWKR